MGSPHCVKGQDFFLRHQSMMWSVLAATGMVSGRSVSSTSPRFKEGIEYQGGGLEDHLASQGDPTPSDGCCDHVLVNSTNTEILDYQSTRLGHFTRHGQMGGRPTYRQNDKGQNNYLYYQGFLGVWFVGEILGANERGLKNWGDAKCAEELMSSWSYYQWGEGTADGWVEDKGLKVTCEGPGPHPTSEKLSPEPEACTFGDSCSGCAVTAMVNGVTYCCASDCDHGEVNVWEVNGRVQCKCFH